MTLHDDLTEFRESVRALGRTLRDELHLIQIVEWLNHKLTRT